MSVSSYFVYSQHGKKDHLVQELLSFPECSVYPSEREDLLILVTETKDKNQEENLMKSLESLPELSCMALVYTHGEGEVAV